MFLDLRVSNLSLFGITDVELEDILVSILITSRFTDVELKSFWTRDTCVGVAPICSAFSDLIMRTTRSPSQIWIWDLKLISFSGCSLFVLTITFVARLFCLRRNIFHRLRKQGG